MKRTIKQFFNSTLPTTHSAELGIINQKIAIIIGRLQVLLKELEDETFATSKDSFRSVYISFLEKRSLFSKYINQLNSLGYFEGKHNLYILMQRCLAEIELRTAIDPEIITLNQYLDISNTTYHCEVIIPLQEIRRNIAAYANNT